MPHELTDDDYRWALREVALNCMRAGARFDDHARSEAGLALVLTARRYDPAAGASFRTYAGKRIRWAHVEAARTRDGRRLPGVPTVTAAGDMLGTTQPKRGAGRSARDASRAVEELIESVRFWSVKTARVLALLANGLARAEAAAEVGVSESRICQMLRAVREVAEVERAVRVTEKARPERAARLAASGGEEHP